MQAQTGCDAVMIGRAAIGNPWLFRSIAQGRDIVPSPAERITMYLEHTRRLLDYKPGNEAKTVAEMRKFAARYINGFPGARELRQEINAIKTYAGLEKLLLGSR